MVLAACHALPPPPVMAPHAPTEPNEQGAITAIVAIGYIEQIMGGDGWGIALRIERQQTARTTIGGELTGGRGSEGQYEDGTTFHQSLIAVRGYSRTSPSNVNALAISYGAGLSWLRTGAITGTLQTSFIASYPNDHLVPLAALSVALAVPLVHGRAFGEKPMDFTMGEPEPRPPADPFTPPPSVYHVPHADLFFGLDLGLVTPFGRTGNAFSVDAGAAVPLRARDVLVSVSAADSQRF